MSAGRWLRLLERLLPRHERAHLRGELERLYRVRRGREGAAAADRWLRRQVLAFVPVAAARAVAGAGSALLAMAGDARRTARSLLRTPGFSLAVVSTLSLGIGATALVFSLVHGVLVRPLPFDEPDGLVSVWGGMSQGELDQVRQRTRALVEVRGWLDAGAGVNLEVGGEAYRVATSFVEPGLFDLLGARPLLGRLFAPEESEPGRNQVTLLGEALWRTLFGADPGVVGRSIVLDGRPFQVVGVLPRSWRFPDPADRLWLPLERNPAQPGPHWGNGGVRAVGRLSAGATPATAQEELRGFSAALSAVNPIWTPPPDYRARSQVRPLRDELVGDARPVLLLLLAAVATVFLVVCANVSSLLAARALERGQGVAVRTALGAGRLRVAGDALAESLLLGIAGAVGGTLMAKGGLALLVPSLVGRLPRAEELSLDASVLGIAVAAGLAAGVAAGLVPALRAMGRDPGEALRSGGRGTGPGLGRRRLTRLLVGLQVAAAVVLVTSATLLVRTLSALGAVDPGFDAPGLQVAQITFPSTYDEVSAAPAYRAVLDRVEALPGVQQAALAGSTPFGVLEERYATGIEDAGVDPNDLPMIDVDRVDPGYFEVMGIPLLAGRGFGDADGADAPPVAVVDELMAGEFWPGESPVGKRIRYPWAGAPWIEVVGVVGSVADDDLALPRRPRWYVPLGQRPAPNVTLVTRSTMPVSVLAPALRSAVAEVDPHVPLSQESTYRDLMGESAHATRLTAGLLLGFALVTLFLGCLGVHAVAAHMVRERRREIGVRIALGASTGAILGDVVKDGLRVALPAALLGLLLAALAARALAGMLYGVSPLDPLTFAAVPLLTLAAACASLWLPARRASRLDPVESLRQG